MFYWNGIYVSQMITDMFCLSESQYIRHLKLIIGIVTWVTGLLLHVEHELFNRPEQLGF
jgi:hypothetical protein